jgi:hypothetical protein
MQLANAYSPIEVQNYIRSLYPGWNLYLTPYAYTVPFTALAQNGQQNASLSITANADFLALGVYHRANIGAAQNISTKTAPFIRCLITDAGTNEQWTNAAVDLENYSTNGNRIHTLPFPRLVQGNTALSIQVTNFAPTAETYAFDLMIEGIQIKTLNRVGTGTGQ